VNADDVAAIHLYSAEFEGAISFYTILNTALRSGEDSIVPPFKKYIWLLLWAMRKCPVFEGRTLYRGVKMDLSSHFLTGQIKVLREFLSCRRDIEVESAFLGSFGPRTLFVIELCTNQARVISQHSLIPEEKEALLPPNSQLMCMGSRTKTAS
jgi:NAD:arginine ADP-ribosyltransferase